MMCRETVYAGVRRKWLTARSWRGCMATEVDWSLACVLHACGRRNGLRLFPAIPLKLRHGGAIWLRPGSSDFATFREIFIEREYNVLREFREPIRGVLDLGANIGLAARWLRCEFPGVRVLCVEPDALNATLAVRNLAAAIDEGGATVMQAFAGGKSRTAWLSSGGSAFANEGRLVDESVAGGPPIPVHTVAALIAGAPFPIDTVKIDVEGAEGEIFASDLQWLDTIANVVAEIHSPLDERWLRETVAGRATHRIRRVWSSRPGVCMAWLARAD